MPTMKIRRSPFLAILALVCLPAVARADAIIVTKVMTASTIAEIFIAAGSIRVELEIGGSDLRGFRNLMPDGLYEHLGYEPRPLWERLGDFFGEDLVFRVEGGRPFPGRVLALEPRKRVPRDEITGEPLPTAEGEGEDVVFAELEYRFEGTPATIVMSPPTGDEGRILSTVGMMTYHEDLPVNDFRYLSTEEILDLDWDDPWYSKFRNRNLWRQYEAPINAFLYVEPYEVRVEIIVRPLDMEHWLDLGLEGQRTIPVDGQYDLQMQIADFLARHLDLTIDGELVEPELDRVNFLRRSLRTSAVIAPPEELDAVSATLGVIYVAPTEGLPQEASITWDLFTDRIQRVPAAATDEAGPLRSFLQPDEMRVIACGTGMPTTRAAQTAACFLVELGNGDKFLFDIGSGSAERISSLQIPYNYLDKVFVGHLHTDHFGALHDLFVGGALMGRNVPLRVWGPSGPQPELGTAYALEHLQKMLTWDLAGRAGNVDFRGYQMEVTEFDYQQVNEIVYQENGVTIRSFPAIHSIDGPISYSLEWNGLKFVFSSDTYPNTWFAKYALDADLVVHECFIAVPELVSKMGFTPESALLVGTQVHTAPEAFGKVMSVVEPRMAVAYHFFKDWDTTGGVFDRIRKTYGGPLSLAEDFMVWNVTKDDIRVRMAVVEEATWSPPLGAPAEAPSPADRTEFAEKVGLEPANMEFSEFTNSGLMDVDDVLRPIFEEASEVLGRECPYPGD